MRRFMIAFRRFKALIAGTGDRAETGERSSRRNAELDRLVKGAGLMGPGILLLVQPAVPGLNRAPESIRRDFGLLLTGALRQAIREEDLLMHLDDGSYAIFLVGAPRPEAEQIAERICSSVADTIFLEALSLVSGAVFVGGAAIAEKPQEAELSKIRESLAESRRLGPNTYCIAA